MMLEYYLDRQTFFHTGHTRKYGRHCGVIDVAV